MTKFEHRLGHVIIALSLITALSGCGASGTEYAVGDCLKTSVNSEGRAEKTDCSDPDSFTVTMLAKNGGQPNCPYYVGKTYAEGGAAYVTDTTTKITYCGKYNGPY